VSMRSRDFGALGCYGDAVCHAEDVAGWDVLPDVPGSLRRATFQGRAESAVRRGCRGVGFQFGARSLKGCLPGG
jgi:hypothetical protein